MDILKIFSNRQPSKEVAKDRLKLILIHDRSAISPETLEMIRVDILKVISNYVDVDIADVDISLANTEDGERGMPALVANIPIKNNKK
jgi:cell division topological specificity factor